MIRALQEARIYHELSCEAKERFDSERLWHIMWDLLMFHFNGDVKRVCYVTDLFLQAHLLKKYGRISNIKGFYKAHLLRGLDKFHW